MGRRHDPSVRRIKSKKYAIGYAKELRGKWVIFIRDRKFSTPYLTTAENAEAVRTLIDQCYERVERERIEKANPGAATHSLYALVDAWYAAAIEGNRRVGDSYRRVVKYAIKAYAIEGRDTPLEPGQACPRRIADQFQAIRGERGESDGTAATYLRVWKRIFTWGIQRGLLSLNPIDLLRAPVAPRKPDDKRQYTDAEFSRLLEAARQDDPESHRLYRFLFLTGMRIHEALGLTWNQVTPQGVKIHGKGYGGEKKIRHFPLRLYPGDSPIAVWQREIREILEEQACAGKGRERVWRWQERAHITWVMERQKRIAGLPDRDGRAFHTLRSMAEHHLQYVVGLPLGYVATLLGHTVSVAEARYAIIAQPQRLADILDRFHSEEAISGQNYPE